MDLDPISLGSLIRQRRKELGLTLSDLANDHISVPTISNIERGITNNLASEKVHYIRQQLGLSDKLVKQMLQSTEAEQKRLQQQLAVVQHLIEVDVLGEARKRVSALESDDTLSSFPLEATKTQLLKGFVLRKQGQWERTKGAFQQVLRLLRETDVADPENALAAEAYYHLSLTVVLGDQDYEKAIDYADLGLDVLPTEGERPQIAGRLMYHKANCFYHLDRKAQAYRHVIEAQQVCEQTQDFKTLLLGYNLEGIIVAHQQLYAQAVDVFQQAVAFSRQYYPDPRIGSVIYLNWGDTYYRDKAYEQALACYDLVNELCQTTKDQDTLATLYFSYGEVYYATKEYALATEYVEKAIALTQKMHLTSEYLPVLLLRAKIALGENSDEVKTICEEGIRLAEQSMLYSKKKEFHLVLANYYERVGNEDALQRETKNMYQVESIINGR